MTAIPDNARYVRTDNWPVYAVRPAATDVGKIVQALGQPDVPNGWYVIHAVDHEGMILRPALDGEAGDLLHWPNRSGFAPPPGFGRAREFPTLDPQLDIQARVARLEAMIAGVESMDRLGPDDKLIVKLRDALTDDALTEMLEAFNAFLPLRVLVFSGGIDVTIAPGSGPEIELLRLAAVGAETERRSAASEAARNAATEQGAPTGPNL